VEQRVTQGPVGGQQVHHPLGQQRGRLVAEVPEGGVVGELAHLLGHRVGDFRAAVAHIDVEQAREAVDQGATVGQLQLHPAPAHEDLGAPLLVLPHLVDGMDEVCTVEGVDFLAIRDRLGHGSDLPRPA
jgi:hypothetical protein